MDRAPSNRDAASVAPPEPFKVSFDDLLIVPLVALGVSLKRVLKSTLMLLVRLVDFLFPILLQVMRFPLFTLRILGDGIAALSRAIVAILPVGGTRRAAWRESISLSWAWLRKKISYQAFEEWIHHAFESGMAWVFKTCRTLTPLAALIVLLGAVLWLPISFAAATLLHGVLIAKAAVLPAWMQLLHPFATIIAKSKLLVLPVYPAGWPRAKEHPLVQSCFRRWRYVSSLYLARKARARYGQMEAAFAASSVAVRRSAEKAGFISASKTVLGALDRSVAAGGRRARAASVRIVELLASVPLFGGIVRRYERHYDEVSRQPKPLLSRRVSDFYERWSIKFTAKYYEDREREQAAKAHAG
jgi:hypothetical protein